MLLNIDKPRRTAVLHGDDCNHIPRPHGTPHKPVGELGRDGGWFAVASEPEARKLALLQFPRGDFVRCQHC